MSGLSKSVARFYVRFSVFTMDAAHSSNMRLHQSRHLEFSCSWTFQVPHLIGSIWAKLVSAENIWETSTTRLHVDLHFWWDMDVFTFVNQSQWFLMSGPPRKQWNSAPSLEGLDVNSLGCPHPSLLLPSSPASTTCFIFFHSIFKDTSIGDSTDVLLLFGEKKPWLTPWSVPHFLHI